MCKKQEILILYFEMKMDVGYIAKKINVSKSYIYKILNKDSRFDLVKQEKKEQSKTKKKEYTKKKMNEIRQEKYQQFEFMKQQHLQATRELSSGSVNINNNAFRKWNSSAYKYNKTKKCYEFDRKLGKSYAVPRYIK